MDEPLTVSQLFERHVEKLALRWVAGRKGGGRTIECSSDEEDAAERNLLLAGHLNLIHPNRVQVLGRSELRYLASLGKNSHHDALVRLFEASPAFIIIADGEAPTDELSGRAEQVEIPLFSSQLRSYKLIGHLNYYLTGTLAERVTLHGVFMDVRGLGVLLTGESGVGKSELALELVTRGHCLIADDAPEFSRIAPDTIHGACPELLQGFLEVRGLGVINIRAMYGDSAIKQEKNLRLIIALKSFNDNDIHSIDRLVGTKQSEMVLGVAIPRVILPVTSGRNLSLLIEAAVRNHILCLSGYNAADDFIERQRLFFS